MKFLGAIIIICLTLASCKKEDYSGSNGFSHNPPYKPPEERDGTIAGHIFSECGVPLVFETVLVKYTKWTPYSPTYTDLDTVLTDSAGFFSVPRTYLYHHMSPDEHMWFIFIPIDSFSTSVTPEFSSLTLNDTFSYVIRLSPQVPMTSSDVLYYESSFEDTVYSIQGPFVDTTLRVYGRTRKDFFFSMASGVRLLFDYAVGEYEFHHSPHRVQVEHVDCLPVDSFVIEL